MRLACANFTVMMASSSRCSDLGPNPPRLRRRPLRTANTATPFRVRFPDGSEYRNSESPPAFILSVRHERALRRAALYGHVGVLEPYFDGEPHIEASPPAALAAGME